jgi:hypothetical protein
MAKDTAFCIVGNSNAGLAPATPTSVRRQYSVTVCLSTQFSVSAIIRAMLGRIPKLQFGLLPTGVFTKIFYSL